MKQILLGAFGGLSLGAATLIGLLQAGAIDMAADTPHNPTVYHLIEWAREQAIARRAAVITPPDNLSDSNRIRRGAGNYDAMCVSCHLSPGMEDSEIRKGLYPIPPNLSKPDKTEDSSRADARLFWIIKHGVKASGMPAWSKGGMEDEAIWDLAAFLKIMPTLSMEEYRQLIETSNGHSHGGLEGHEVEKENIPDTDDSHHTKPHVHKHHTHEH